MTGNDLFLLRRSKLTKKDSYGLPVSLSQADIGEIVDRSPLTIHKWEKNGKKDIPESAVELLKKYCAKRGVLI